MKRAARHWCLCTLLLIVTASAAALPASPAEELNTSGTARRLNGYLMAVAVSINGNGPFDFLVDTGTNTTLIDPGLAAELNLRAVDRMSLATLSDATPVVRYYLDNMRIGPASVAHVEVLAAPLKELHSVDNRIRGVLGMNFLLQFSFLLDYRHHRVEIFPFPDAAPVPEGKRVKVRINDSRILVPVASDSALRGTWNLVLDSGIAGFLVFQSRTRLTEQNCQAGPCMMQVSTNGGKNLAPTRVIPELSVADTRLFDQPVTVLPNELLKPADPQDGLLPASLFRSVFFDRSSGTLVLQTK